MRRALSPAAAGIALSALCLILAPSVAFFDSGELAATAASLGVSHPTGFPLFNLAGHLLTLLPLGPLAMRVHLLGALAGVAAVLLWTLSLSHPDEVPRDSPRPWHALNGAAILLLPLTAPALMQHARSAEIYPLVWLLVGAALLASVRLAPTRRLVALGLLSGLAALLHIEALLVIGMLGLWALWEARENPGGLKALIRPLAMGALLGLLALIGVAYLPLAAQRMPAFSWGDLRNLDRLWAHLSAQSIRDAFAGRMGVGSLAASTSLLLKQTIEGPAWLTLAALPGAASLFAHRRRALGLIALVMGLDLAYTLLINPMGLRDSQVGLLFFLGIGILGVQGVWAISETMVTHGARTGRLLAPALLPALAALELTRTVSGTPVADLQEGARIADKMFQKLPPGALLISAGDDGGSACAWMQAGEGARPDSPCVPGVFARDRRMMRWLAHRTGLDAFASLAPSAPESAEKKDLLAAWLRPAIRARPVLWQLGNAAEDLRVFPALEPGLPWSRLRDHPPTALQQTRALETFSAQAEAWCASPKRAACQPDRPGAAWLARQLNVLSARLLSQSPEAAGHLLQQAATLSPHHPPILNNLAVFALAQGHPQKALALCERAISLQPDYSRAHRTAARAALHASLPERTIAHARATVRAMPKATATRWLHALAAQSPNPKLSQRLLELLPSPVR